VLSGVEAMGDPLSTGTIGGGDTDGGLGVGDVGGFRVSYLRVYTENYYSLRPILSVHIPFAQNFRKSH
jgi:hypothetical protein